MVCGLRRGVKYELHRECLHEGARVEVSLLGRGGYVLRPTTGLEYLVPRRLPDHQVGEIGIWRMSTVESVMFLRALEQEHPSAYAEYLVASNPRRRR